MDLYSYVAKREVAKRTLVKAALHCALDEYHDDPADPGWQNELDDENLIKAAEEFHQAEKDLSDARERLHGS